MFSSGQQEAFAAYENGENIFISGYAGTGKSYLINQIYKLLDLEITFFKLFLLD